MRDNQNLRTELRTQFLLRAATEIATRLAAQRAMSDDFANDIAAHSMKIATRLWVAAHQADREIRQRVAREAERRQANQAGTEA